MENMLGLFRFGHYNEVALLLRWPLSEVSLYHLNYCRATMYNFKDCPILAIDNFDILKICQHRHSNDFSRLLYYELLGVS